MSGTAGFGRGRRQHTAVSDQLKKTLSIIKPTTFIDHRRAESWLSSLIATTRDAIISIDGASRIVLFNSAAEKIFGYTQAEIQGQKVNLLMAEPFASEHDEYIARFERTKDPRAIGYMRTVTGRRKNGETFPVEISTTMRYAMPLSSGTFPRKRGSKTS